MASYMGHEYTPAPKYKVGDRVQTLTDWGECAPKGSFGTVHKLVEARGVTVKIDGGDGFDWYYKLADVKPAPAEQVQGRHRVGDRVRVVKDGFEEGGSLHGAKVGDVDEIVAIDKSDPHPYEGRQWYYGTSEISPAFRPGDRVKLNKHSGVRACGERGTVSAVIGDNVSVRMDDMSAYGTVVAFFHADNLDWERAEDCKASAAPEPKFKAGDVVTHKHDHTHRKMIKGSHTHHLFGGGLYTGERGYDYVDGGWDLEVDLELVTAAPCPQDNEQHGDPLWRVHIDTSGYVSGVSIPQPAIVALIVNGKPRPSTYPHVHSSVAAATKEAERLARNNPGQEFAVYQRVAGRQCEVSYEMKEVA